MSLDNIRHSYVLWWHLNVWFQSNIICSDQYSATDNRTWSYNMETHNSQKSDFILSSSIVWGFCYLLCGLCSGRQPRRPQRSETATEMYSSLTPWPTIPAISLQLHRHNKFYCSDVISLYSLWDRKFDHYKYRHGGIDSDDWAPAPILGTYSYSQP